MNFAEYAHQRANEKLDASKQEEPNRYRFSFLPEEQNTAQYEPNRNQDIVDIVVELIAVANVKLVIFRAQLDFRRIISVFLWH